MTANLVGPPLPPPESATLGAALRKAAASPHGITFVSLREEEERLPFGELLDRARRVGANLVERGIRRGDRVALVLPTSPQFVSAFFGVLEAGAVPVPLYPPVRLGRLGEYHRSTARMLDVSGARAVIADERTRLLLGEALAQAKSEVALHLASTLEGESPPPLDREADPSELALIQFSSGSTVDPKPVALSHRALLCQLSALKTLMPADSLERRVGVSWLPLYHDMGLIGCLLAAVDYPGALVLIPPEHFLVKPALWLRALSRHRGGISPAPNFAFGLCAKRVKPRDLEGVDLSAWRYALNGAEPISAETARKFLALVEPHGFDPAALLPVYGLSEAALAVTFTKRRAPFLTRGVDAAHLAATGTLREGARELVSVGTPVPGAEVALRRDEEGGRPCEAGEVGRVFVRAPFLMDRYFGDDAATSRARGEDGFLDTGDVGFVADGELYLCGRKKDLVIIRGANHLPHTFEDAAMRCEGLRAGGVAAVGRPSPSGEEALVLLAERERERNPDDDRAPDDLAERISARVLEDTGIAPAAVFVLSPGTLPRTSSGKIRRGEALRRLTAGTLAPPANPGTVGVMKEIAKGQLSLVKKRLFG